VGGRMQSDCRTHVCYTQTHMIMAYNAVNDLPTYTELSNCFQYHPNRT